jgi:hypothetical protein
MRKKIEKVKELNIDQDHGIPDYPNPNYNR